MYPFAQTFSVKIQIDPLNSNLLGQRTFFTSRIQSSSSISSMKLIGQTISEVIFLQRRSVIVEVSEHVVVGGMSCAKLIQTSHVVKITKFRHI